MLTAGSALTSVSRWEEVVTVDGMGVTMKGRAPDRELPGMKSVPCFLTIRPWTDGGQCTDREESALPFLRIVPGPTVVSALTGKKCPDGP